MHIDMRCARLVSVFFTMRPIVSYDDITLPYEMTSNAIEEASKVTTAKHNKTSIVKPSSKKRKRKSRYSSTAVGAHGHDDEDVDYLEVEENRELTHTEIWDDSALIDAWNAATEEYKV